MTDGGTSITFPAQSRSNLFFKITLKLIATIDLPGVNFTIPSALPTGQ